MKRVLVVPWSIAAAYFAIVNSFRPCVVQVSLSVQRRFLDGKLMCNDSAEDAADDRPHHRYQGVLPIGCALAGDRKDVVRDAGSKVTGRIDRVTGRARAHPIG